MRREADELIETDPAAFSSDGSVADQFEVSYETLSDRYEAIKALILDGTFDPYDAVFFMVCPTEAILESERLRREREARKIRRRYSEATKEQALALVAGGASYRKAAAATLGHERHAYMVFRWARAAGVKGRVRA